MSSQESIPSWNDLKDSSAAQPIGAALNDEVEVRKSGKGSAHASNKLRLFDAKEQPKITLYRDSAGKTNFITVAARANKRNFLYLSYSSPSCCIILFYSN
eukprot:scaffold361_cov265-Chaetoceros_neogracile.AAC.7